MTDTLRTFLYDLGLLIAGAIAFVAGWVLMSRRKLRRFHLSNERRQQIQDSRIGWYADRDDPQKEDPHVH